VLLPGFIDDGDLPAVLSAATVFVYPSIYEGFGMPPLEAMACGTPVVASNAGSLPEVLGSGALLPSPYDVQAIGEAMASLLSDESLRARLTETGIRQAACYTWSAAADRLLAAYHQAVGLPKP
jgi:glycosyltransferase involved in cell wall biosynthesis